jgi:hypothetical protein
LTIAFDDGRTITVTKTLCIPGIILTEYAAALAQDVPKAEWFLSYNYVRVNSATNVPAYSSNGGSSQIAINFSKYVSGVVDLGGYYNGIVGGYNINASILAVSSVSCPK